jgi:hypothetical protein
MIVCKFCGKWNLEPAVFCTYCGRRAVKPKLIKLNWLLLIVCGILLLILLMAFTKTGFPISRRVQPASVTQSFTVFSVGNLALEQSPHSDGRSSAPIATVFPGR